MNPLLNHYRRSSSISLQLPSGGFYGGDIDFNMNKEVEIFPLSAKNEIYINNPEHLLSGEACSYSISECCPNVKDIANLPYMDMEVICLGIKKASYGGELKMPYRCPHCKHEGDGFYSIDHIFSMMKEMPEHYICEVDNLKIYMKPFTLENLDQFKLIYTNEKIAENTLKKEDMSNEDKAKVIYDSLETISTISTESIGECIIRIIMEDGTEVTDKNYIMEYYNNAPVSVVKKIVKFHNELSEYGLPKKLQIACESCNKEFDYPMVYDPSSFFD